MFQIIPAIDLRSGRCVRLEQGDFNRQTVYDGSPVDVAREWEESGAELIHIVDLDGAKSGHPENIEIIRSICSAVSCVCELGGGMRKPDNIRAALDAGVGRVILGTVLAETPALAATLLEDFSPDQLVAGLDARDDRIATQGWQSDSSRELLSYASELFDHGLRHFIYTDIATDGMFTGPNLDRLEQLCVALPDATIIASGGIENPEHVKSLVHLGRSNLSGVIVGKALYDGRATYRQLTAACGGDRAELR